MNNDGHRGQCVPLPVTPDMKVVLAEKPSVARELAQHLRAHKRHDGWFEGRGYQVTWAFGHLAGLKTPDEYDPALKRWTVETLPFIPERFELRLEGDRAARRQFATIRRLFHAADSLVCATDAGREGELIFRYIVSLAGCEAKPAERLWLSSMTARAMKDAFDALRPAEEYDNLYAAARSRSEADWIVGVNATRNSTVRCSAGGVLWSVGRVQTPVLAMIVGRDDEIRHFAPVAYWELTTHYRDVTFSFAGKGTRGRHDFATDDDADVVRTQVTDAPLEIEKITSKEEKLHPPRLFDLTTLQREMNQRDGMSAQVTLDAAQDLYEKKLITYPRTDSRYLELSMYEGVRKALGSLSSCKSDEIGRLDVDRLAKSKRVFDDKKVTDHHAIVPTGQLPSGLPAEGQRVFDAIVTRLIAVFYPPCVKAVTIVDATAAGVLFRAKGTRIVDPGWTMLTSGKTPPRSVGTSEEQALPAFKPGESGPHEPQVEQKETRAPRVFSESSLLGAMETAGKLVDDEELSEALKDKGLGTPATRASIIETLLGRGYIAREKKALRATDLGRYLISIIADERLKSPELTGEWEGKLKRIEQGAHDAGEFMQEIADYIRSLVATSLCAIRWDVLGECPRCGATVVEGRRAFGCSQWRSGCGFVLSREYRGLTLNVTMVRELLQRRIVLRPSHIGGEARVLRMTANGAVEDLEAPSRDRQRRDGRIRGTRGVRAGRRMAGAEMSRSVGGDGSAVSDHSTARRKTTTHLCRCPQCGRPIIESQKGYGCSGWREGCTVTVWKEIAGKKITKSMVAKLLTKGKTQILKGFVGKSGKPFEARLVWHGNKVGFEFAGFGPASVRGRS